MDSQPDLTLWGTARRGKHAASRRVTRLINRVDQITFGGEDISWLSGIDLGLLKMVSCHRREAGSPS